MIAEPTNPEIQPTHVLLGLIAGKILLFPNLQPKKKANVSQTQTLTNNANV